MALIAAPPIHVWMPNHPQATSARKIDGTWAPMTPNGPRTSTGNGMPYFVPACAFSTIGIRTMKLPVVNVPRALSNLGWCNVGVDERAMIERGKVDVDEFRGEGAAHKLLKRCECAVLKTTSVFGRRG